MNTISRSQLPDNFRIHNARAAKRKKGHRPLWIEDPVQVARTHAVYEMYLKRAKLPEIQQAFGISVSQIYRDIDNARDEARIRLQYELKDMMLLQLEERRQIVEEAYVEIEMLRRSEGATPQRARAVSDLLKTIAMQEQAIEELVTIRVRGGRVNSDNPDVWPGQQDEGQAGRTLVFDVQNMNIYPPAAPDTTKALPEPSTTFNNGILDASFTATENV